MPPLGQEGNPAEMPRVTATHIITHVQRSVKMHRHWLTLDKALYEAKLAEFKETGNVRNPIDRDVIATARKVITLTAAELEEYDEKERREEIGLSAKKKEVKAPTPDISKPKEADTPKEKTIRL